MHTEQYVQRANYSLYFVSYNSIQPATLNKSRCAVCKSNLLIIACTLNTMYREQTTHFTLYLITLYNLPRCPVCKSNLLIIACTHWTLCTESKLLFRRFLGFVGKRQNLFQGWKAVNGRFRIKGFINWKL